MLYLFAAGLLYPAATSGALEPFPEQAGSAGALVGGLQNIGACLGIFISSLFAQHSQLPLGILLTVMSALVGVIFLAFL
jgi:DHA1 family 2-module integral membrane pump EmrD-like MFS transporter